MSVHTWQWCCYCYMYLHADVCSTCTKQCLCCCKKLSEVGLTHDGSSQFQFDLIQVQAMANFSIFAMILCCLLDIPVRHQYTTHPIALPEPSEQFMNTVTPCLAQTHESMIIGSVPCLLWHKHAIQKWLVYTLSIHNTWMLYCGTTKGDQMHVSVTAWCQHHLYLVVLNTCCACMVALLTA